LVATLNETMTVNAFHVTIYYTEERKREFHYKMPSHQQGTDSILRKMKAENPDAFCVIVERNGKESQWINPDFK
jgi:hypothetical protein